MVSAAPAFLLIVSMLSCPFRCSLITACDPVEAAQSCSCCEHAASIGAETLNHTAGDREDTPAVPEEDCGCSNCPCNGAVLTDDWIGDAFLASHVVTELWPPAADLVLAEPRAMDSNPLPLSALTGRSTRLVLRSLQI